MKVTDMLMGQHAMLSSAFTEAERVMEDAETEPEVVAVARLLEGLVRDHIEAERTLFFAPLDAQMEGKGESMQFAGKHEEYVDMFKRVAQRPPGESAIRPLRAAIGALRQHFQAEERVVIPLAEKTFDTASLEKLGDAWLRRERERAGLPVR